MIFNKLGDLNEKIKEKILDNINSWESCNEVKSPTEQEKLEYAIEEALSLKDKEIEDLKKQFPNVIEELKKSLLKNAPNVKRLKFFEEEIDKIFGKFQEENENN